MDLLVLCLFFVLFCLSRDKRRDRDSQMYNHTLRYALDRGTLPHTHKCPRGSALGTVKVHGAWVLGRKGVRWPGGWSWRQKVGRHACCCKLHVPFQGRYFQVYTVYTALRCCPLTMKRSKEIIQDTRMCACEVLHLLSRCQTSQSLCGNFPSFYALSKLFCPSPGLAREGDFFVLLGRERRQNVRPDDGQLQDTTPYGVFE